MISCPKCEGKLYLNEDKDLRCLMCGNNIVLRMKVYYTNTRNSKGRVGKEKVSMSNLDRVSTIPERSTRNRRTSYYSNAMVRERGLYRKS